MVSRTSDWRDELGRWLKPFLDRLGHKARRQMCPLYVSGLIGPGDRKSVQPMAKWLALGACDQLHHFIAAGVWDATPVGTELLVQADRLVGGSDAVLVIDDTAIPKKGTHSVGVAAQYASALGKTANCQPVAKRGRPRQRHVPDLSIPAEDMLANAKWRTISSMCVCKTTIRPRPMPGSVSHGGRFPREARLFDSRERETGRGALDVRMPPRQAPRTPKHTRQKTMKS